MAEKIKLFELDIDSKSLITSLANTRKEIEALTKAQKENTRSTEEEQQAYEANAVILKQLSAEYRDNQKVLDAVTKAQTKSIDTVDDARKALSAISVLWAQVTKVEGANSKQAEELAAQKLKLTNRLKELEAATGDTRRNVGNYTQSILEAVKGTGAFAQVGGQLPTFLEGISNGFKAGQGASTGFIGGLKGIGGAITATGIGAFVQVIALLVTGLSKLKVVTDPIEQAFAGIAAIVQELVNRFEVLSEAFGFLLKGEFSKAADQAAKSVDGLGNSLANAANEAARLQANQQDLDDELVRGKVITAEANKQIDILIAKSKDRSLSEAERIKLINQANELEKEQFKLSLDNAKEQERIDKAKLRLATGLTDAEIDLFIAKKTTEKQDEVIQKKLDKNEEQYIKFTEARIERINIERQSQSLQERLQGRINTLNEQRIADEERAAAAAEKAAEQRQKAAEKVAEAERKRKDEVVATIQDEIIAFQTANKSRLKEAETLTSELAAEEVARQAKLSELQVKLAEAQKAAGKLSSAEFSAQLDKINEEFTAFTTGLSARAATEALDRLTQQIIAARTKLDKTKSGAGLLLTPEQVAAEKQALADLRDAELAALDQKVLKTAEREAEIFKIKEAFRVGVKSLDDRVAKEEEQREAFNFQTKIDLLTLQGETELNIRREQLARQQEVEIAAAEAIGASVSDVEQKYRLLNQQLEREAINTKLSLAANYLTQFAQLVGENTEFGKLAASAAAIINTYEAITEALNAPTLVQRIANVAFATATGFKAVAQINSTKVPKAPPKTNIPKLEEGGFVIGGKRHSQGGTVFTGSDGSQFEAEKDEAMFVLNRNATSQLKALSSLNQLFPAMKRVGTFQSGGFPQQNAQELASRVTTDSLFQQQIVVDVKDIITQTERRVQVVDSATV